MNQIAEMFDRLKMSNPLAYLIITIVGIIAINTLDYFIMFGNDDQTKMILQSISSLLVTILTLVGVRTTRYLKKDDSNTEQ